MSEELGPAVPSKEQMLALERLITDARMLEVQIEKLETELKERNKVYYKLTTTDIPEAMAMAGTIGFTTTGGLKVKVSEIVRGSLPKTEPEKRAEAIKWLEDNHAGDIIKDEIVVSVDKGQHNASVSVVEFLNELGLKYKQQTNVHPQTLAMFARERLRNGEHLPLETLGLIVERRAKIEVLEK